MKSKNNRTMEQYLETGALARLLSDVGAKTAVAMSRILPAKESDKLAGLLHRIGEIVSKTDSQMYKDFPDIGHEGAAVFYGTLSGEPRNELDGKVMDAAKEKALELFGTPAD